MRSGPHQRVFALTQKCKGCGCIGADQARIGESGRDAAPFVLQHRK